MKIFEVQGKAPRFISPDQLKGTGEFKGQGKLPVSLVKVAGTDAEDLEFEGQPIKGRLLVIGDYSTWEDQKNASHFYYKMNSGILQRVDDKALSSAIVKSMNVANQPPSRMDRLKGKVSDFFDPNNPERAGYRELQKPGAVTGKTATAVTRGLAGLDNLGYKVLDYFNKKSQPGEKPTEPKKGPDYRTTDFHNYGDEQPTTPKKKTSSKSAEYQRELRRQKKLKSGDFVTYKYGDNKTGEGELRGIDPTNKKNFVLKMIDPFNPNAPKDKMGHPMVSIPRNLVFKK